MTVHHGDYRAEEADARRATEVTHVYGPDPDDYEYRHREEIQRAEDAYLDGLIDQHLRRQHRMKDEPPDPDEPPPETFEREAQEDDSAAVDPRR